MKKKNPIKEFERERRRNTKCLASDKKLQRLGRKFMVDSMRCRYSYNFDWLGRPIIQHPQDMVAMQELIWKIKPDLVIETGIARGGSLILSASILELLGGKGKALGVDIEIRKHNLKAIKAHRLYKLGRIKMLEGSSTDSKIVYKVRALAKGKKPVLIFLDSNHSHDHVLRELELYSPLVTRGSYIVAFDTVAEWVPRSVIGGRPWGRGNNPLTAVRAFLRGHKNFVADREIDAKLLISAAPGGFLKRVK